MGLTIDKLRVELITPTYDCDDDPPSFFGNVISYRRATIADLIEVLEGLGAERRTITFTRKDDFAPAIYGLEPGSYIVWRIEEK